MVYSVSFPGHPLDIHNSEWNTLAPQTCTYTREAEFDGRINSSSLRQKTAAAQTSHKRLHLHSPLVADKVLKFDKQQGNK